mmetsp:Transcript_28906/g.52327  ORF Transcript_28906/g.52327 Transcript_28906/m.52327 type:complete len:150 (+) Transcript_28906:122-571(+)
MGKAAKKAVKKTAKAEHAMKAPSTSYVVPIGMNNKKGKRLMKHKAFREVIAQEVAKKELVRKEASGKGTFNVLSLSSALTDGALPKPKKNVGGSNNVQMSKPRKNKAKKSVGTRELAQFQAVLAHGAFQANPLATLKEHLTNTCRPQDK